MTVLLSNDDGVYAAGIIALEKALSLSGKVKVVAPSQDRSGVSNCLTLDRPLQTQFLPNDYVSVDGTPTDCVHLGVAEIFMPVPLRVISGINHGANMGDDVLYSGTVAAAMEGRYLDKPAIAFSLVTQMAADHVPDFDRVASLCAQIVAYIDTLDAPPRTVYNVNIPFVPEGEPKGIKLTRLGQRLRSENPVRTQNPRGKIVYWIGRAGGPVDHAEGTDFAAVHDGYISVTPLHADMTCYAHAGMAGAAETLSLEQLAVVAGVST